MAVGIDNVEVYKSIMVSSVDRNRKVAAYMITSVKISCIMRKPAFCMWENKGADQLQGNCTPDQRLCFGFVESSILLLPKYEILSLYHLL